MTQNDMERKERGESSGGGGMPWLWIALGIVLILLLGWWFWPDGNGVDPYGTDPDATETGFESTFDDEARVGESGQPGADRADQTRTSSDRTVAVPASPGITTRDVENVDSPDGD